MAGKTISLNLRIWRQAGPEQQGRLEEYYLDNINTDMSFLEMIDVLNGLCGLTSKDDNLVSQGDIQGFDFLLEFPHHLVNPIEGIIVELITEKELPKESLLFLNILEDLL